MGRAKAESPSAREPVVTRTQAITQRTLQDDHEFTAAGRELLGRGVSFNYEGAQQEEYETPTESDHDFVELGRIKPKTVKNATGHGRELQRIAAGAPSSSTVGMGIRGQRIIFPEDDSLIVNEDDRLIKDLGFGKWKDLLLCGPVGLIEGVIVRGERVFCAELKQGRVPCACLYTEQEFKTLIIEAHYHCRYHVWNHLVKDKRFYFWCKYCQKEFSDKNGLSYHRYRDQCGKWREIGTGILKMYPTFLHSDQRVVKSVLAEAGLTFPKPEGRQPWNPRCRVSRREFTRDSDSSVLRKQELKLGDSLRKDKPQMQGVAKKGRVLSEKPARAQGVKRKLTAVRGTDDRKTVHRSPTTRLRTRDESEESKPGQQRQETKETQG